jgi:hypothetical protein
MLQSIRLKWAEAIAIRISDEWSGATDFPECALLLNEYLQNTLSHDADAIQSFIGTGVIESDYFD